MATTSLLHTLVDQKLNRILEWLIHGLINGLLSMCLQSMLATLFRSLQVNTLSASLAMHI
jgi:hypothetical protein